MWHFLGQPGNAYSVVTLFQKISMDPCHATSPQFWVLKTRWQAWNNTQEQNTVVMQMVWIRQAEFRDLTETRDTKREIVWFLWGLPEQWCAGPPLAGKRVDQHYFSLLTSSQLDFSEWHSTQSGGWKPLHQTPHPVLWSCFWSRATGPESQSSRQPTFPEDQHKLPTCTKSTNHTVKQSFTSRGNKI